MEGRLPIVGRQDLEPGLFQIRLNDPNQILGKTTAGTLKLSTDRRGLRYEIEPPATQAGRDVLEMVARGDLDGSSFSFYADRVSWEEGNGADIRILEDVTLVDCGPVCFPAYTGSTAEAASREHRAWRRDSYAERLAQCEAIAKRQTRL